MSERMILPMNEHRYADRMAAAIEDLADRTLRRLPLISGVREAEECERAWREGLIGLCRVALAQVDAELNTEVRLRIDAANVGLSVPGGRR